MPRKNIIEPWHEISPTISKAPDQPAHMHSLIRAFASRLNILWVLSLKGGCTGSSESTLVRMPHCVAAQFMIYWLRADAYDTLGTFISQRKGKNQTSTTNLVFHASSAPFMLEFIVIGFFFFMQTHEKETQLSNYVWCAKSVFVRQFPPRATRVLKQQQHVVW